jgi:DnaK suppressor protein
MPNRALELRRRRLQQIQQRIQSQLDESETSSSQELSSYDNHPADLATDTFFREIDVAVTVGVDRRLDLVRRAMEKVDQGTYGICDRCGGQIGDARLSAIPEAVYCVACERELHTRYQGPPSEAEVVEMPFGDQAERTHDGVEFDGEDSWQAVAQYGTSDSPQDAPPAVDYFETFVDFDEPIGIVEDVEGLVDDTGEVLLDQARAKPRQTGDRTQAETDHSL